MTEMNTGAQVFVGNQPATVVYDGRDGVGPGDDRLDFVVPDGVTGCYVSLKVNVGGGPRHKIMTVNSCVEWRSI